ncbi:MAG TPA: FAD-binding oxidoreductase [Microvirga sp.]|jgi:gamma-glutamylputrescine oxidase|nr:FAD-binding oxidoreductase [Microvirga sp.]
MSGDAGRAATYYEATATPFSAGPPVEGDQTVDVAVVGAGYTGLGAALALAQRGYRTLVVEQGRTASGASGRNGGQIHPGHRRDMAAIEAMVGDADARKLWALAEEARAYQTALIAEHGIDCSYRPGLIHAAHKRAFLADYRKDIEHLASRYGYGELEFVDRDKLAALIGTDAYQGGMLDRGGGHVHALNWALGIAGAAQQAGARISEHTRALSYRREGGRAVLTTSRGTIRADWLLLCADGSLDGIDAAVEARVMPINNFMIATEPLGEAHPEILPGGQAVSDSRFVVNYWRLTPERRLLWGGGENYRRGFPRDIRGLVSRHMLQAYPRLQDVRIDHAWGGTLGITMRRVPYVRRLAPNLLTAAGYSGVGVMLGPYFGKLLGEAVAGNMERVDLLSRLPVPPFPGGKLLRWPTMVAGLSYYALRDRL